jgi:hypothetical protein
MNSYDQFNQILTDLEKQAFVIAVIHDVINLICLGIVIFLADRLWKRFHNVETHLKNISDAVQQNLSIVKHQSEQASEHKSLSKPTTKPPFLPKQNPASYQKPGNIHEAVDAVIYNP